MCWKQCELHCSRQWKPNTDCAVASEHRWRLDLQRRTRRDFSNTYVPSQLIAEREQVPRSIQQLVWHCNIQLGDFNSYVWDIEYDSVQFQWYIDRCRQFYL